MTAICHRLSIGEPSRISAARLCSDHICSALACIASLVCHALVNMHLPDPRSTNRDMPRQPSVLWRIGQVESRKYAIPPSINEGCDWMVVERAYTVSPSHVGAAHRLRHRSIGYLFSYQIRL